MLELIIIKDLHCIMYKIIMMMITSSSTSFDCILIWILWKSQYNFISDLVEKTYIVFYSLSYPFVNYMLQTNYFWIELNWISDLIFRFGDEGCKNLCIGLEGNMTMLSVSMCYCDLGVASGKYLGQMISTTAVR